MTLNSVGGRHGRHGPSRRLLLFTKVSANINLLASGHPKVTFDVSRFMFGLLFVSFTKALHNADFDSDKVHIESCFSGCERLGGLLELRPPVFKIQSIQFRRIKCSVRVFQRKGGANLSN